MLTNLYHLPLTKCELIRNPVLAPPAATFLATGSTGINGVTLSLPRPFTECLEFAGHKAFVGPHITNKVVILTGAASP